MKPTLRACFVALSLFTFVVAARAAEDPKALLADEVHFKGWIIYSAKSDNGTWDLFLMRPDGTDVRNLTNTPDTEEAAPRFSPDSSRILYRAMEKGTKINHDKWGFQGKLMIAKPDGTESQALGAAEEFPWASWSPDGKSITCLTMKGIQVVDIETKKVTATKPRNGIYQQLFSSPDGKWFTGTGNVQGESWTVVRMDATSGKVNPVHVFQSCTPDWFPDSQRIIYSSRPKAKANGGYGWTQLWSANGDGTDNKFVFGEEGVHIYGGAVSPDSNYVLFTKCPLDGGGSESEGAPICLMRLADAPIIQGDSPELHELHTDTKNGPVLELVKGWEPCWTDVNVGAQP